MEIEIVNPSNEEIINQFDFMNSDDVTATVNKSHSSWLMWKQVSIEERIPYIKKLAIILRDNKFRLAKLMALEMGKPLKDGVLEIEKCALCCDYYISNSISLLADKTIVTDNSKSYTTWNPLGVILAIMPWNYPFWQVIRHVVPTILAGNTSLLKHAPNVTGCSLAIEDIFKQTGIPEGVFSTLIVDIEETNALIGNSKIKGVTLTGSTNAGKAIAKKAGSLIKKTVLELGGNDPYLILEDADLDLAVSCCVLSRLQNAGQSCIAAKRFIVNEKISAEFENMMVESMASIVYGNPLNKETDIGPMAREDLRDQLHKQIERSIDLGAKCILGGKIPKGKGFFYPPTILTNVKKGMPAYDEEMFGPVATIINASDDEHAVKIANDSIYGLGAAVFTKDIQKGERIVKNRLEVGICAVNTYNKSYPSLPFGGIKESGYGRELSSHGLTEFMNLKTIVIN